MIKKLYLLISLLFSINLFAVEHDIHKQIADIRLDIQKIKLLDARDEKVKKIEALQNELDELRNKLIESRLDKEKIKKDFGYYNKIIDRQDKRIEDFNIYFFWYGILITILLFVISYVSYKFTSNHARDIVNDWLKNNKDEILEPIKNEAKDLKDNIEDSSLKFYQEKLKEFLNSDKLIIDEKLNESQEKILEKVNLILERKEKEEYTFDDWYSKYLGFKFKDNKKALFFINKAIKHSSSDTEKINALVSKANFLTSLDEKSKIYDGIKIYDEIFEKFKDSDDDEIKYERIVSMYNRGITYLKLKDRKKEIESYDKFLSDYKYFKGKQNLVNLVSTILLNKIEYFITINKNIDDEINLLKEYDVTKETDFILTILKLIEKAKLNDQSTEISKLQDEYKNIKIKESWSFDQLLDWANDLEDQVVKKRILSYIEIFKNHNKNIKED